MIVVKTAPNKLWRGTDKAFRLFGESIDWVWLKGEANALAVASANNANAAQNDASRAAPRLPTLSAVLTPPVHMFRPDLFRPLKAASYQPVGPRLPGKQSAAERAAGLLQRAAGGEPAV